MRPPASPFDLEPQDGKALHALGIVADPLGGGYVGWRDPPEPVTHEELRRALFRGAGEHAGEPTAARFLENPREQLGPDSLALEPADRVEGDHLAGSLLLVALTEQRPDTCEMTGRDGGTESGEEDFPDLLAAADLQEPFALASLEQPLHFTEVVDAERLDPAVLLESEERAGALVGIELAGQAVGRAQVDRGDAGEPPVTNHLNQRTAVVEADPLCLS